MKYSKMNTHNKFVLKVLQTLIYVLLLTTIIRLDISAKDINCKSTFKDIPEDTPICYYVNFLDYERVIRGYSDLTYRPETNISRGELSQVIARAFNLDADIEELEDDELFPDVDEDNIFYKYIHILKKLEIINGYTDGEFKPEENVTRAQAVKFIVNSAKHENKEIFKNSDEYSLSGFDDVEKTNKFYDYILEAYAATRTKQNGDQIISISNEKKFNPELPMRRDDLAKMIANTMLYGEFLRRTDMPQYSVMSSGIKEDNKVYDSQFKLYYYEPFELSIVTSKRIFQFDLIRDNEENVEDIANKFGYKYLVNSSFFGKNAEGLYEHAGFLNFYGDVWYPLRTDEDTRQLTHIVRYDKVRKSLEFVPWQDFETKEGNKYVVEFQTGPLVLKDNEVQKDLIYNSKNGRSTHTRTMIGYNDDGEYFLITFRTFVSLNEAADILTNLKLFKNQNINIINLDGGSSVTFYSKDYPEYNFNTDAVLPLFIGLR